MDNKDSNLTPLLKGEIEGDYQDLIKNKDKVLNLIDIINKDIETLDFKKKKKESISIIKEKFEDLEKNMKKYSQGLNYINSYYDNNKNEKNKIYKEEEEKIDFDNGENLLISLSQYSSMILNKYQQLNKKFELKIKNLENQNESKNLSQSYDVRKSQFYNSQFSKDLPRSSTREKIRMEKREFNQLLEKNKNILSISNDIKKITDGHSNLLSHSSTNIDSDNFLINDEIKKLETQKILRNKKNYWISGGLIIIIIIIIVYFYDKYNAPSNNQNNQNIQK